VPGLCEAADTQDADLAWAWMTSPPTASTGCSPHTLQDRRPRVPSRRPAVTLTVIPSAARPRYAQAARTPSPPALALRLRHHGHEPQREAPAALAITASGSARRPGNLALLDRTPDPSGRHSAVTGVPALATRSCRTESGTALPCMRWRVRARHRRADWPVAWSSPRAARRGPVLARGPVSRLLPRSRRRPG
jgi:hypothetical protein